MGRLKLWPFVSDSWRIEDVWGSQGPGVARPSPDLQKVATGATAGRGKFSKSGEIWENFDNPVGEITHLPIMEIFIFPIRGILY